MAPWKLNLVTFLQDMYSMLEANACQQAYTSLKSELARLEAHIFMGSQLILVY